MSVPARRGPWWYYARTEEGKDYAIHCRRPARGPRRAPAGRRARGRGAGPARRERTWPRGHDYFAVGRRGRQPRPPLAGLLDRPTPATSSTSCASVPARRRDGRPAPRSETVPDVGTGWPGRADADCRLLRPLRRGPAPLPAVASPPGHRPGRRRARLRGDRPPLLPRHRIDPGRRVRAGRPAQHQHQEWLAIPSDEPLTEPRVVHAPPRGDRVRGRPPHAGRPAPARAGSSS